MKKYVVAVVFLLSAANGFGQQVVGEGDAGGYHGPFERGFQSTRYCGNNPESWVRGSAWLDKQNGFLTVQVNLETDATHAGPKGQVLVFIYDANGNLLTRVATGEVGMGGKPPGTAVQRNFQATFNCGPYVGSQAVRVVVVANCLGSSFGFWGVTLEQVRDALGFIQQFVMYFF